MRRRVKLLALGPLEARVDERPITLGGKRQQAVLVLLLLYRGTATSRSRLADELWGENPPPSSDKSIQIYVSNLRKQLGDDVIVTRGAGYALASDAVSVDVDEFETLVDEGHRLLEADEPVAAAGRLREALALWRGPPLGDLGSEEFACWEAARLDELRLAALEERFEADLALGEHTLLVPELERLVREHPLRERLRAALMLALYRSDRQADALAVYRDAHRVFRDELGLEPSPTLRELERRVLSQDPALAISSWKAARRSRRRGVALAAATTATLAAVVAAAWMVLGGPPEPVDARVSPNSVAVLDARTSRLVAEIPVGELPGAVATDEDAVWVASAGEQSLTRIDPATLSSVGTVGVTGIPEALAIAHGSVWVGSASRNEVLRVHESGRVERRSLPGGAPCSSDEFPLLHSRFPRPLFASDLAAGPDTMWFACATHVLARIDATGDEVVQADYHGRLPIALAYGLDSIWVANLDEDTISAVDEFTGDTLATITVPGQPSGIAIAGSALWVTACADGSVWRIEFDARGRVPATLERIEVGAAPQGIAAGAGSVWVANGGDGTVTRIEAASGRVTETFRLGHRPARVATRGEQVWVTVQRTTRPRGGCSYP